MRIFASGEPVQFGESVEDGVIEGLAFRGDTLEIQGRVKDFVLNTSYSLERPLLAAGDAVKVLICRLYAFKATRPYWYAASASTAPTAVATSRFEPDSGFEFLDLSPTRRLGGRVLAAYRRGSLFIASEMDLV